MYHFGIFIAFNFALKIKHLPSICAINNNNGGEQLMHLLVSNLPQLSILEPVFRLEGTSSMLIRKRNYPTVRTKLWNNASMSLSFCFRMQRYSDI
ncbi:transposase [Succinatimonas hippei]|uniref:transposase n=1 Tax=Succinatimonas hippei TaxID=626938 RepID=UPI003C701F88